MALTEMVIMPGTDYQAICNAVRAKTGHTALLVSGEIAALIDSIQAGGGGGGEKVLYMDAALLAAGGAYPADAADYTEAVIPAEATYVDLDVFDNLPNVTKVTVNGNCDFETHSVYNSYRKTYVDVPVFGRETCGVTDLVIKGRDTIEESFLFGSQTLVNLEIEDCGSLGSYVCQDCAKLESVTFKNFHGSEIGAYAFLRCTSLKEIVIPESVGAIHLACFNGCSALETITFLGTETTIGQAAIPSTTIIRGYAGSAAETYANSNGYTFEAIG